MRLSLRLPATGTARSTIFVITVLCCSVPLLGQLSVTLTPSVHNGFNISCNGGDDGAIDLSVSGGTPPYTYAWSTGATTQDVSGVREGFISVVVLDAASGDARKELTLTEPNKLEAVVTPYLYPSGFNISCFNCFNGSIQVSAAEGVPPYTYAWADGPTTEDRAQLDAGSYQVDVMDNNGCSLKGATLLLTQPERDDWSKSGNADTDPSTQFLGTTDNKDLVVKTNNSERLRLKANGDVRAGSLSFSNGYRPVFVDSTGVLKSGTGTDQMFPGRVGMDCCPNPVPWFLCGNNICQDQFLGTKNLMPLKFKTHGVQRMVIEEDGDMVFGTSVSSDEGFRVNPDGEVGINTDPVDNVPMTLKRNQGDYIRFQQDTTDAGYWSLHNGNENQNHLAFHYFPGEGDALLNRLVLWNNGKVSIGGAIPGTDSLYNLYVEGGIATRDVLVKHGDWPDFVFARDYPLQPLAELRAYLRENAHLPALPSAAQLDVKGGVALGDIARGLTRTVEEQALYILQLEERLNAMDQRLKVFEASQH